MSVSVEGAGVREPWRSNATLGEVAERLRRARRVVVLTHAKPDGDAVGSTLSVARALGVIGVEARVVYAPPWAERFDVFVGATAATRLPESGATDEMFGPEPDAVVICDTGSWQQLDAARGYVAARREKSIVLDHHPSGDAETASVRHIEVRAAAACEITAELCGVLLGVAPARFPLEVAEPLYLGIATDTGFFCYSNTTPRTLRLAADLIEAGVDHNRIFQISEQSDRPARLRLLGRALAGMTMHDGDRVATLAVTQEDLSACGADVEDVGGLTDFPLSVGSVRVVAVLTEMRGGLTKVSLRSKPAMAPGQRAVDVNAVANTLGGGGHVRAAGAKVRLPLEEARRVVVQAILAAEL